MDCLHISKSFAAWKEWTNAFGRAKNFPLLPRLVGLMVPVEDADEMDESSSDFSDGNEPNPSVSSSSSLVSGKSLRG